MDRVPLSISVEDSVTVTELTTTAAAMVPVGFQEKPCPHPTATECHR
jgi:hypothetical protein